MAYIKGKKAILTFYKDGAYTPFLCATGMTITINTDFVDTRTIGDGYWEKIAPQSKSYGISFSGLIELQETSPVTFWLIENYDLQMLPVSYRAEFLDEVTALVKYVTGEAYIVTSILNGVATGFASSSFELRGTGALVITTTGTACEGTIGSLSYTAGDNPGELDVQYEDVVTFGGRLEYSVDGGGRVAVFDPGTSGEFTVVGLTEGDHTIEVWAVCENGVDGESNGFSFHIDEGGDPGVGCNAPPDMSFSAISSTGFTVDWIAATPTPTDGYYWELINFDTMTTLESGTQPGTSKSFTGLTAGVNYQVRARSVCETGVSQSAYTSSFIILVAACNVPGTPSMSVITGTTATASWTAPSPAPGDGYDWELVQGVSVVQSGHTTALFINLTSLAPETTYTLRVKSICVDGVSESGFNSIAFVTGEIENNIDWNFSKDVVSGAMIIYINGAEQVSRVASDSGNFSFIAGDDLSVVLSGIDGQFYSLIVEDITDSITIYSNTDGNGFTMPTELLVDTHNYTITAVITAV
jgi:hypothetical protein